MDAVINSGPREDSTRVGSAGVVRRQAVDLSPFRRVNQVRALTAMDVFSSTLAEYMRRGTRFWQSRACIGRRLVRSVRGVCAFAVCVCCATLHAGRQVRELVARSSKGLEAFGNTPAPIRHGFVLVQKHSTWCVQFRFETREVTTALERWKHVGSGVVRGRAPTSA